jgi:hypothetical protein
MFPDLLVECYRICWFDVSGFNGQMSPDYSAISDVRFNGSYYAIYDASGKKGKESHQSSVGELCGIGTDFIVFLKTSYYATYDENFKKIAESHKSSLGDFKNAAGASVNFIKNSYIGTYDKNLKKQSERHI